MDTAAESPGIAGELGRLRALVRLHVILAYRQVSGSSLGERVAGKVVMGMLVVWLGFFTFGLAKITFRIGQDLGPHTPAMQGFFVGFALAFALIFAICGLFEKGMGGGIDVSRLFHLPVPVWAMVSAGLATRFAAPHILLPLGLVIGYPVVAVSTGHPWYAVAFLSASLLWLVHLNLILMLVSLLTIGARTSRRFVERAAVVGAICFFAYLCVMLTPAQEHVDRAVRAAIELAKGYWDAVYPFVLMLPGVCPLTWIHDGARGVLLLILAVAEAALMFVVARRMLERLAVAGAVATTKSRRRSTAARPVRQPLVDRLVRLPLLAKDLKMMVRDPTSRLELLVFAALPMTFALLFASRGSWLAEPLLHHVMPLLIMFMLKDRITNHLCREVSGLLVLLGSTVPRWRLLVEKNLGNLVVLLVLMLVPSGLLLWHGATVVSIVLDYVFAVAFALPFFGAGNLLAILAPVPMTMKKGQLTTSQPMSKVLLTELVQIYVFALVGCFALPLLLVHLVFVEMLQTAAMIVLAIGGMLIYGLGIYVILLAAASALFSISEPELYEKVVRARG